MNTNNFLGAAKAEGKKLRSRLVHTFNRSRKAVRSRMSIVGLVILAVLLGVMIFIQISRSVGPGSLLAYAQGPIGVPTLTLGDYSIRPINAVITDKSPVCLVLIAAEIREQVLGAPDSNIFLMGSKRTFAAASITPIGNDSVFGQQRIRAFAFHPTELCRQGDVRIEDLSLLVVRPAGVGIVSFAAPKVVRADK